MIKSAILSDVHRYYANTNKYPIIHIGRFTRYELYAECKKEVPKPSDDESFWNCNVKAEPFSYGYWLE